MSNSPPEQPEPRICTDTTANPSRGETMEPTAVEVEGASGSGSASGSLSWAAIEARASPGAAVS